MLSSLLSQFSLIVAALFAGSVLGQNTTSQHEFNAKRTLSVGYIVFPGFTTLDVFGPLDMLVHLSGDYKITLSTISFTTGPISARIPAHRMDPSGPIIDYGDRLGPTIIATHDFQNAPALDVIIVPGGGGQFGLVSENNREMEKFLTNRAARADYILSVCIGATTLARAGLLSGKRATTNKAAWEWATDPVHGKDIDWQPSARWVVDGKIWTSSGVAAGMDMMYAFLKHLYGNEKVDKMVNGIEYAPHLDPHWDPFSVVHNVPGADTSRSLTSCVGPVGNVSQVPSRR